MSEPTNVSSFGLLAEVVGLGFWKALSVRAYGATCQSLFEQLIQKMDWADIKMVHKDVIALSKQTKIQNLHY